MDGHVFQTFAEHPSPRQFKETMEQLKHYVGLKLKFPEDLKPIFGEEIGDPYVERKTPLGTNVAKLRIWEKKLDLAVKRETTLEMSLKQL